MATVIEVAFGLPDSIPAADEVVGLLRGCLAAGMTPDAAATQAVREYPDLEVTAPAEILGQWLGIDRKTIYANRSRTRADGSPLWPEPEPGHVVGKTTLWRFVAVALNRAQAPGRGHNFRTNMGGSQ